MVNRIKLKISLPRNLMKLIKRSLVKDFFNFQRISVKTILKNMLSFVVNIRPHKNGTVNFIRFWISQNISALQC